MGTNKRTNRYLNEKLSFSISIIVSLMIAALFIQNYLVTNTSYLYLPEKWANELVDLRNPPAGTKISQDMIDNKERINELSEMFLQLIIRSFTAYVRGNTMDHSQHFDYPNSIKKNVVLRSRV